MVSINLSRVVLSALLILALFPFALRAEEESLRVTFRLLGDELDFTFSKKESEVLKTLIEKNTGAPDTSGKKIEAKPYGYLQIGTVQYQLLHGVFFIEKTQQFVSLPEKYSKKLVSIMSDNTINDANRTALIAFVLKDWISEEAAKK
jgi:hypothetical protein